MEEQKNKEIKNEQDCCSHSDKGHGCCSSADAKCCCTKGGALRLLLKITVLVVIFLIGVSFGSKIGENEKERAFEKDFRAGCSCQKENGQCQKDGQCQKENGQCQKQNKIIPTSTEQSSEVTATTTN